MDAGCYRTLAGFQNCLKQTLPPDMAAPQQAGVELMPVVYPGYSTYHLRVASGEADRSPNSFPRDCGRFYQGQAEGLLGAGATMIDGAMFDEVDE
jgi:hypothetical protein